MKSTHFLNIKIIKIYEPTLLLHNLCAKLFKTFKQCRNTFAQLCAKTS